MKGTCEGCKALNYNYKCGLGYQNEIVFDSRPMFDITSKPLELCLKPITVNDYVNVTVNRHNLVYLR